MKKIQQPSTLQRDFDGVGFNNRSKQIVFSKDGEQFFTSGDTIVRSWDVRTKRLMIDLSGLGRVLAVGPHGKTVLTAAPVDDYADLPKEGHILRLYDVTTRRLLSELRGMTDDPGESTISDDGALVAPSPDDETSNPMLVWDVRTGQVEATLESSSKPFQANMLRFSPNRKQLVVFRLFS